MEIPDSIAKLTNDITPDPFNKKPGSPEINIDEIIFLFKKSLTLKQLNDFETGFNYFKTKTTADKVIAQNFISLFSEALVTSLKNSNVLEEEKEAVVRNIKKTFVGLNEIVDSTFENLTIHNKNKNLLDVKEFTLIIVGYAIGLLKKMYSS